MSSPAHEAAEADALDARARTSRVARTAPGPPPPGAPEIADGVERLIAELRARGVEEGRQEAARILAGAQAEAARLLAEARAEAGRILAEAQAAAGREAEAGREALAAAARDTILALRADLLGRFSGQLRRMVRETLDRPEILGALVLAVAGQAAEAAGVGPETALEVQLPDRPQTLEDLRADLESARQSPLTRLVADLLAGILREGVVLKAGPEDAAGLRVRLTEADVEIDLSDAAITGVLLAHLKPRFRALFERIIA